MLLRYDIEEHLTMDLSLTKIQVSYFIGLICIGHYYQISVRDLSPMRPIPRSTEGPLLEFEVGSGRVIKGFDEAVRGLAIGESREVGVVYCVLGGMMCKGIEEALTWIVTFRYDACLGRPTASTTRTTSRRFRGAAP
jgi:hypothetical protein